MLEFGIHRYNRADSCENVVVVVIVGGGGGAAFYQLNTLGVSLNTALWECVCSFFFFFSPPHRHRLAVIEKLISICGGGMLL